MARSAKQKLKLLYILKFLYEQSDSEHPLSTAALIEMLEKEEIHAERKSIYSDMEALSEFGVDILKTKAKDGSGYYLASRDFELAELKLLVDAVIASKFITIKKSNELIHKLEHLVSPYEAKQLSRQVYVMDRIKNSNESIFINVDTIHRAMQENTQIRFLYYEWGPDKEMHFRKDGAFYQVSPFFLLWRDENYYLVAYDEETGIMKHYRVDKMAKLETIKEARLGQNVAKEMNPASYAQHKFGMFAGQEQTVSLKLEANACNILFDRFGKDIYIREAEDGRYMARVNVTVSPQFFGWLTGVAPKILLSGPDYILEEYRRHLDRIYKML